MHNGLNFQQAVAVWIGRELGIKKRDLCAKYDVDPRRLYEVWEEERHVGSKHVAERLFKALFAGRVPIYDFQLHEPKFMRTARDQLNLL